MLLLLLLLVNMVAGCQKRLKAHRAGDQKKEKNRNIK